MSQEQPQPIPLGHPTFQSRTKIQEKNGTIREQTIFDPYGHRYNTPGVNDKYDEMMERYAGILGLKSIQFGHIPEKQAESFMMQMEAAVGLDDLAYVYPSHKQNAKTWKAGRVIARAEVWSGVNGQAVISENTKIQKNINVEQKPSRWRLH